MFAKESLNPFTNNDDDRGLGQIKTKIKVIGVFRQVISGHWSLFLILLITISKNIGLQ